MKGVLPPSMLEIGGVVVALNAGIVGVVAVMDIVELWFTFSTTLVLVSIIFSEVLR